MALAESADLHADRAIRLELLRAYVDVTLLRSLDMAVDPELPAAVGGL